MPACVFISRVFAAGDSYKDTNQGMRNEGTGRRKFLYLLACEQKQRNRKYLQLVPESKEFSREGGGEGGGESYFYLESFSETFAVTKIIIILKLIGSYTKDPIDQI